ncbi:MAG TPA: hypothetical protein VMY18_12865 [Acidobacteriota bacterium]|nr:hypothetical protein [Acidobacteriota bacterium]
MFPLRMLLNQLHYSTELARLPSAGSLLQRRRRWMIWCISGGWVTRANSDRIAFGLQPPTTRCPEAGTVSNQE